MFLNEKKDKLRYNLLPPVYCFSDLKFFLLSVVPFPLIWTLINRRADLKVKLVFFVRETLIPFFHSVSSRPSSSFKHNASFVSRLPTIRRHKSTSLHSPSLHKLVHQGYHRGSAPRQFTDLISSAENLGF